MSNTETSFMPGLSHKDNTGDSISFAPLAGGECWVATTNARTGAVTYVSMDRTAVLDLISKLAAAVVAS